MVIKHAFLYFYNTKYSSDSWRQSGVFTIDALEHGSAVPAGSGGHGPGGGLGVPGGGRREQRAAMQGLLPEQPDKESSCVFLPRSLLHPSLRPAQ